MINKYEAHWISVKDRLPRNYISVLAYMPRHYPCQLIHECYIGSDGEWHSSAVHGVKSEDITHWMPIPEPPKEDDYGYLQTGLSIQHT